MESIGGKEVIENYFILFSDLVKQDQKLSLVFERVLAEQTREKMMSWIFEILVKESLLVSPDLKIKIQTLEISEKDFNRAIILFENILVEGNEDETLIAKIVAAFLRQKKILFEGY